MLRRSGFRGGPEVKVVRGGPVRIECVVLSGPCSLKVTRVSCTVPVVVLFVTYLLPFFFFKCRRQYVWLWLSVFIIIISSSRIFLLFLFFFSHIILLLSFLMSLCFFLFYQSSFSSISFLLLPPSLPPPPSLPSPPQNP